MPHQHGASGYAPRRQPFELPAVPGRPARLWESAWQQFPCPIASRLLWVRDASRERGCHGEFFSHGGDFPRVIVRLLADALGSLISRNVVDPPIDNRHF